MTGKQDICVRLSCDKIGANRKAGMTMYVIVPNCEKMCHDGGVLYSLP